MAYSTSTTVLKYSGEIVRIDQLQAGDLIMGEYSQPVRITKLKHLRAPSLEVHPNKGKCLILSPDQPIVLKKSAYLEVKRTYKSKFLNMPVWLTLRAEELYHTKSHFKRCFLVANTGVEYNRQAVPIDPYFLGVWLGDGHAHVVGITTMDEAIKREIYAQAKKWGLKVTVQTKKGNKASSYHVTSGNGPGLNASKNPLLNTLKKLNLIRNKHIPLVYLKNDRATRLQLLAGLIDTDGYVNNNVCYITQKSKLLTENIVQLASTLGFRVTVTKKLKRIKRLQFTGEYYSITLSGRLDEIPTRLERKKPKNISGKYDRRYTGYRIITGKVQKMVAIATQGDQHFLSDTCMILSPDKLTKTLQELSQESDMQRWLKKYNQVLYQGIQPDAILYRIRKMDVCVDQEPYPKDQ